MGVGEGDKKCRSSCSRIKRVKAWPSEEIQWLQWERPVFPNGPHCHQWRCRCSNEGFQNNLHALEANLGLPVPLITCKGVLIELPSNSVMNCTAFFSPEHITDGNKGVIFNQAMLPQKRFLLTLWSFPLKSISDWQIKCDYIYTSLTQSRQQNNSLPETFFFFIFRSVSVVVLGERGGVTQAAGAGDMF